MSFTEGWRRVNMSAFDRLFRCHQHHFAELTVTTQSTNNAKLLVMNKIAIFPLIIPAQARALGAFTQPTNEPGPHASISLPKNRTPADQIWQQKREVCQNACNGAVPFP